MARKSSSTATAHVTLAQVKERRDRALREGRFMQGLDLAKQVYKAEPSAENRTSLFNAYVGRGRELRNQNKLRDAATTLQNAVGFVDADPGRIAALGQELAACGEVRQAFLLLQQVPDSPARQEVLNRASDAAIRQEAPGRATLPEELRADFDRVMQAFAQLEAGQDEGARETFHAIGLRSPFAEWKLFLRGLHAYYTKDDARAIENWQRLNPERLAARLAAPLRMLIDQPYRLAQPPVAQPALQQQMDRLQDQGLSSHLRQIQVGLSVDDKLPLAFRTLETVLPALRQLASDLVPRLASCFYWAIVNVGSPNDVPRYLTAFGPPPDDPKCQRMSAMACERYHNLEDANKYWQDYEQTLADNPIRWPGESCKRARALIWLHMGRNAASVPDMDAIPNVPDFLRTHPNRPKPCKPAADKCYLKSINLSPDLLPAHEALVEYHKNRQESAKAEKAARRLLEQFPEHEQIHEDLADFLMKTGKYAEALQSYQRALTHHPLNGNLRKQISTAHLHNARSLAESKRFEEARAAYRAALEFDPSNEWTILCEWASCEFKAGATARAEELLSQASAKSSRLGVAYAMLIEAIRMKLARPLKTRFDDQFKQALGAPPNPVDAEEAIGLAAMHRTAAVKYTSQKMYEKNILAYVAKVPRTSFTEGQLVRVCESMLKLEAVRSLRSLCKWGARKFRKSAMFPFIEAESYFIHGVPTNTGVYSAKHLFEDAQRLASAMPSGDSRTSVLDQIHSRQKAIEMLGGDPLGFLKNMMDAFDDLDFDDDEDDNDSW